MESNWVKVHSVSSYVEAEILQKKLMEDNIPSTLLNKQDSMHIHLNQNAFIEIFVAKDNAFQAVQIISKLQEK